MKCRGALIFFLCLVQYVCLAQLFDEGKFAHYTVTKGLSDNFITGLAQDQWGYIWAATRNGLNRYDGKEFKAFHQGPGSIRLLSDQIHNILTSGKWLLVYGNKGCQLIDLSNNHSASLVLPDDSTITPYQNDVVDAKFITDGGCLVSTYTGLYAFDSSGKIKFRYDPWKTKSAEAGKRWGSEIVRLSEERFLHIDNRHRFSIYDVRTNTLRPVEAYRNSYPGLFSIDAMKEIIRWRPSANQIVFYSLSTRKMVVYDIKRDKVQLQPPAPEWFQYKVDWQSRWLALNDTTAIIYGTVAGLVKVHIDPIRGLFTFSNTDLFASEICNAFMRDREGRLWVGSRDGLFVQSIRSPEVHNVNIPLVNNNPLKVPITYNSFLRRGNSLYVGNYHFLPTAILDAETYAFKKFLSFETLSPKSNQIWNMISYNSDTLWFGTQDGLIWYAEKTEAYGRVSIPGIDSLITGHSISLLYKDSEGDIWLQARWGTGLVHYDPVTKKLRLFRNEDRSNYLPLRVVNYAAEDAEHNIWFGENGLIRWNRKKDAFDTLMQSYAGFNARNPKIFTLCNSSDGKLVFSNQSNGILIFDPVADTYQQISSAEGLPENFVLNVISFGRDQLCVVTRNFVTVLQLSSGKKISYSYGDGLPQSAFNFVMHDPLSHRLLLGYDDEVVWIKDDLKNASRQKLPFYVDALQVANDTSIVFPSGKVELSHKQHELTLHFSSLNFEDPQSERFAYRINGGPWELLGNENVLRFSSLAPGKYNLAIKNYSTSESDLENIKELQLVIHYPFWQTTWFYVVVTLAILGAIYFFYRRRLRQVKQKAAVERQYAELEIKALHAQMNPHFVFNCMNGIREMILNDENQQASRYLSKFAHLMRLTLTQSSKPFISLKDTADYLQRYLEMEEVRSTHFTYTIQAEGLETRTIYLPPMLIQPLIENALWHGATALHRPLHIAIRFFEEEDYLVCIIDDDGIGIDASRKQKGNPVVQHQSVGIENVRERIRVLNEKYNLHSSLTIEDKSRLSNTGATGTLVTIRLLIKNSRL